MSLMELFPLFHPLVFDADVEKESSGTHDHHYFC